MYEEINLLKILKNLMIISGIWRLPLKTKFLQTLYDKYSILYQSYFYMYLVTLFIEAGIIWRYSMELMIECLNFLIFSLTVTVKAVVCQTESIKKLFRYILEIENKLKTSSDDELKEIYINYQKNTFFINTIITIYTVFAGIFLLLSKYILYLDMEKNQTYPDVEMFKKPLPFVTWLPFNSDEHYYSAFILLMFACLIGISLNAVTAVFFLTCMNFICSQLKTLQHKIKILDTTMHKPKRDVTNNLRSLIIDHQTIIE